MLKIRFGQLRFVLTCLLQSGFTPLHHACSEGHAEVVTVLLSAGARIEAQNQVRSEGRRMRSSFVTLQENSLKLP
jgi:ankyrin repeat protein